MAIVTSFQKNTRLLYGGFISIAGLEPLSLVYLLKEIS